MKKLISLLLCVLLGAAFSLSADAARITATIVTENVALNGICINNANATYPFLLYREITYFPLTYNLCRFLGLSSDWTKQDGLQIEKTGGAASFVPDETTINKGGSVVVTLPTYSIKINSKKINNASEPWPLLNYNGITYFPLAWRFAVDEFGWDYYWDAGVGLRIGSIGGLHNPMENLLAILNKASFTAHTFTGSVLDKNTNTVETFTASTKLTFVAKTAGVPARAYVCFESSPFPFSRSWANGASLTFENNDPLHVNIDVSGNFVGRMGGNLAAQDFSNSEKAYLLRCFLKLHFIGEQRDMVVSAEMLASDASTETWKMVVNMPDTGFFTRLASDIIEVTVVIDTTRGQMISVELENGNYMLQMTISG